MYTRGHADADRRDHDTQAIAVANGYSSAVAGGTYTIARRVDDPSASISPQSIISPASPTPDRRFPMAAWIARLCLLGRIARHLAHLGRFHLHPWGAGTSDAVSSTTIALPAGNDSTLNLLATAVNGIKPNQTFVVTYTDGTSSSFTQSLSDWYSPQNYAGESQVLEDGLPDRTVRSHQHWTCSTCTATPSLINSAKTVKSLTLPNNRNVVVLAVDVSSHGGSTAAAAGGESNLQPASGHLHLGQTVTLPTPRRAR